MNGSNTLLGLAALLFSAALIAVAISHTAYMESCVCVVNSISRAAVALALSVVLGTVPALFRTERPRAFHYLRIAQVLAFCSGLFFLVQHVFFVLELA